MLLYHPKETLLIFKFNYSLLTRPKYFMSLNINTHLIKKKKSKTGTLTYKYRLSIYMWNMYLNLQK